MDAYRVDLEMSDDNLLLQMILEEHDLSAGWLIRKVGRASSQVYRYLSGEATIPSLVWRVLYEKTRDGRILRLITGEAPVVAVELPAGGLNLPTDLRSLIELRKVQLSVEEELLSIFADGKVDEKDRQAIERYRRHHDEMLAMQVTIRQVIEQAANRKAVLV